MARPGETEKAFLSKYPRSLTPHDPRHLDLQSLHQLVKQSETDAAEIIG